MAMPPSPELKARLLRQFPHWKLKKERRGATTHVYLITSTGNYFPPINGGDKGAYTDCGPDYQTALYNLAKTHNLV